MPPWPRPLTRGSGTASEFDHAACNVIVQQREGGKVEVSAVDPVASMQAIENPQLVEAATKVREKPARVEEIGSTAV